MGDRYTDPLGHEGIVVGVSGDSIYGCNMVDRFVHEYGPDDACCRPLSELRRSTPGDAGLRKAVEGALEELEARGEASRTLARSSRPRSHDEIRSTGRADAYNTSVDVVRAALGEQP